MASALPEKRNLGPTILGVSWAFASLAIITVILRFYVRTRVRPGNLGWDDWSMLLAFLFALADAVFEIFLVQYGIGQHLDYVDKKNLPTLGKLTLVSTFVNTFGVMLVKVSVCLFLLRMVKRAHKSVLWLVSIDLAILVPFTIATCFVDIFQCIPVNGYWNKTVDAKCISVGTINVLLKVQSGLGVVTDFLTVTIALVVISKLQMRRAKKASISIILGLGYLVAACSIVKTVTIKWTPKDYTWDNTPVSIAGNVEYFGGIIVACLPTLRPLFPLLGRKLLSLRSSRNTNADTAQHHPNTELGTYLASAKAERHLSDSEEALVYGTAGTIRKTTNVDVASHHGSADLSRSQVYGVRGKEVR